MSKRNRMQYDTQFSFYEQLRGFYEHNRGKIRSRYNALTKKFLAYNDSEDNPSAYLRRPQFEALEMYVFIKEFLDNKQMHEIFDLWRKHEDVFSDRSYYSMHGAQIALFDDVTEAQTDTLFKQMKNYREDYPNYIYALTMGLGKTILMATCIFYEFLLAQKYPKDKRFCHNALVFAPDKTVLQSLREIVTFDKTKVVPPEYAHVLDANIKFHFLEDSGTTLNTIDNSDFNVIISNTQKIIVKRKHKEEKPVDALFNQGLLSAVYGDDVLSEEEELRESENLTINQRFKKLCRLTGLGIYVDEAHHLFGADLEKQLREDAKKTSLRATINRLASELKSGGGTMVACYNYTGTPYVQNQVLPEVVYGYGLKESIRAGYLKECATFGFENVKNEEFLRAAISQFWEKYGGETYEGLMPKLAFFAATVAEAVDELQPAVESILTDLGIPTTNVLVNVGDQKYTKEEDIRHFNNLDVVGTEGSRKQFLILVNKGREGWNCRSLFGVALYRSPKSKIFVLQATMRCLRQITNEQQTASVFLSKENFDTLNDELKKNFNMEIKDLKEPTEDKKQYYAVRVLPPPRTIKLRTVRYEYSLTEKGYTEPLNFDLVNLDYSKYEAKMYEKDAISREMTVKEKDISHLVESVKYSLFTLVGELARYMNLSPILLNRIISESADGAAQILAVVNKHNAVISDVLIQQIFEALFAVTKEIVSKEHELTLLHEPKNAGYYTFKGKPELVIKKGDTTLKPTEEAKTFHADTYVFDSRPEKECFLQYVESGKVKEIYFTGMFTSEQGDFAIQYYDSESGRIRNYYPDFFAKMEDNSYEIIEVKGENRIEDAITQAKSNAAREIAVESGVKYVMYSDKVITSTKVLEDVGDKNYQVTLFAPNTAGNV